MISGVWIIFDLTVYYNIFFLWRLWPFFDELKYFSGHTVVQMAQKNLYRSTYLNAQHISSAFFVIALQSQPCFHFHCIIFCSRTQIIVLSPLSANCLWKGSQTQLDHWEVLIFTKQYKRLILLLYLSINLSIIVSIKTGIVWESHSSTDFIESALDAQWIIQYEVNTSLSIDVFHFQWHFYLQSVQWLWLNMLITCDY